MIYHFKTTVQDGKKTIEKDMYLSADNEKAFYRRASDQYGVNIRQIEILEEIEDDSININTDIFKKVGNKVGNNVGNNVGNKINVKLPELYDGLANHMLSKKVNGLTQEQVQDKISRGWRYKELVDNFHDLCICLSKYDIVKLYYLRTGMKKNKKYIVLYK